MNNQSSKKKGIIIAGISAIVLIAVLGISFAVWNYSRTTDNQILVAGDIYMKFKENPALTIENAMPSEGPGDNDYFEFTIEGVNKYSKPIWYEIDIQHGEPHETRQTRIEDSLLKFRLVEIKDGNEQTVIDNASYSNLTNKKIWINTIAANTRSKVEITYRLYMWISSSTIIGNTSDAVYDMDTWNNDIYASIKVNVTGDFNEKELVTESVPLIDEIKSKLVKYEESSKETFNGGVIAINDKNELYNETDGGQTIREYRYSGPSVNNYVTFNNETWRIIGVFKEGNEEYIKILKNEPLSGDILPLNYVIDETTYKIKDDTETFSNRNAFFNYITGDGDIADWTTAGLQYYLNTEHDSNDQNKGYLNYLSEDSKNMLIESTYYLGNIYFDYEYLGGGTSFYDTDTTISAYLHERGNVVCSSDITSDSYGDMDNPSDSPCNIWNGMKTSWKGKVGLLYPSDYGFSNISSEWNYKFAYGPYGEDTEISINKSWIYNLLGDGFVSTFTVSPSSDSKTDSITVSSMLYSLWTGGLYSDNVVLPVLTLSSKVNTYSGDGSQGSPYKLSLN